MAAIVTGGAQGIGSSISVALLREGYKVCVADILEDRGKEFVADLQKIHGPDKVIFSFCDVSKEDDYIKTFDLAITAFQTVDVLVNNAGISMEQNPRKVIDVNLMGPIFGTQTALKYMGKSNGGKGGMVINTASLAGVNAYYKTPIYSTSKYGVIGLTRSYGHPYYKEKEDLIFAALCPSMTNTSLLYKMRDCKIDGSGTDYSKHPDIMSPDFVAEGVVKLLKDRINGSALSVTKSDGYQYIQFHKFTEDLFDMTQT